MTAFSRRWRVSVWTGGALATLVAGYALGGFFLAPYLIQKNLWPMLSENLDGHFQAQRTVFHPFELSLTVDGFSLEGPNGDKVAKIDEIHLDVDLANSLKNKALTARGRIVGPSLNVMIDGQGRSNVAFLLPKDRQEKTDGKAFPFLLSELIIAKGRLVIDDQSRGAGFKKTLSPLDSTLENLGTVATAQTHFRLNAQGDDNEILWAEGKLRSESLPLEGELRLEGLNLPPVSAWLAAGQPFAVRDGVLSIGAKYRYAGGTEFEISKVDAEIKQFSLIADDQPFLNAGSINTRGLSFRTKSNDILLESFDLQQVELNAPAPLHAGSLSGHGLSLLLKTNDILLENLGLQQVELKSPTPINIGSIMAQGLSFQPKPNRIHLKSIGMENAGIKTSNPVHDGGEKPVPTNIDSMLLTDISANLTEKSLEIGSVSSTGATLAAWLGQDGKPGFSGLPTGPTGTESAGHRQAADRESAKNAWKLNMALFELRDFDIALNDFTFDPPVALRLAPLNLQVKDFNSADGKPFSLGLDTGLSVNGHVNLEGKINLSPPAVSLKLHVNGLSLPPFQPYIDKAARFRVARGNLNLNADIDYDHDPGKRLRVGGDVTVEDFASNDKREGRDFINWKTLRLNGLIFENVPQRLSIREAIFTEPYVRALLDREKKFNIAENLTPPENTAKIKARSQAKPEQTKKSSKSEKPAKKRIEPRDKSAKGSKTEELMAVVIGVVRIHNARANFTDETIQPTSFNAGIYELNGDIRSLSSRQDAKSDVVLDGRINEGSTVKIHGKINPLSIKAYTDIVMNFNDVNMATLSPYSAKFAGYRIEKGKLSMDLRYQLDNGQLTAENNFVLKHLVLGERVESPTATSLPVQLAISLLKDSDGRIDINLPISGDLSNPDISLRGLLANAASQLITKLVSSPLTMLGKLSGSTNEDLGAVKFSPGVADLNHQEKEKLIAIGKILKDRPDLTLDIRGAAHPEMDMPALAEVELARQLKNARLIELSKSKGKNFEGDEVTLSDEDYRRLLTQLYRLKNPNSPELQELQGRASLSGTSLEIARRVLLDHWEANEMDLRGLARARAETIRNYLVKELGLPDQRIYLLDVKLSEQEDKEIRALLTVSGS